MNIALIGYGKMGRMIEEIALSRGHQIVCKIDVDNQADFDSDAFRSADVAIEFTNPSSAFGNICRAFEQGVKVVSGSTGWREQHDAEIRQFCTEQGKTLFWASNFSLGVAIFCAVNKYLAKIMNRFPEYSVELEETHHIHKLDHPSGTGITLAEQIVERLDRKKDWVMGYLQNPDGTIEGTDEVAADLLPISSIRRDEVPGIHTITWNSEADQITITHDAHSRQGFALGAVIAAEFTSRHEGLLSTDDLFKF
jgi:4-hydroxy-tetrahydrodipicolinate reductase